MFADVRHALRLLAKARGFATAAIASIALGIAANTAIFSFVVDVCWRPLPLPAPESLAIVWEKLPNGDVARPSANTFQHWVESAQSFERLGALRPAGWALTGGNGPAERARGGMVSPQFSDVFRFRVAHGRGFAADDFRPGRENVALLSHRFWVRRFQADPAVIGRTIALDQVAHTVIGVLSPESRFAADGLEVATPLALESLPAHQRTLRNCFVIARLRPGGSHAAAQAEMDVLARRLAAAFPQLYRGHGVSVRPIENWIGFQPDDRTSVLVLFGAVVCLQLIVCANLAALLLARAVARRKEVAVRAALGASTRQLVRQFLTEALVLSSLGGGLGIVLAFWMTRLLVPLMPGLPLGMSVHAPFDAGVAGFGLAATLLTAALFGLLPAWHATRVDLNAVLKENTRGGSDSAGGRRLGGLLIGGEIAAAVALIVAAGLIGQTLWRLGRISLGFNPEHAGYLSAVLPSKKYSTDDAIAGFAREAARRARAVPGVTHAAIATHLPLSAFPDDTFAITGGPVPPIAERPRAGTQLVGPDYLETLGIPLLKGRSFTEEDRAGAPRVALINRLFAEKYFPGSDPIGRQLLIDLAAIGRPDADAAAPWQVVGVSGNVKVHGLPGDDDPMITLPFAQHPLAEFSMVMRSSQDPATAVRAIRQAVNELDGDVLADRIDTFGDIVARGASGQRHQSWLLGGFAAIAVGLASLGIYGVTAYSVEQRTREIGIRVALGAQRRDIVGLIVPHGLACAAAGVVAGLAASLVVGRMMERLLYGVRSFDAATAAAAAVIALAVALVACWLPVRRAVRVEPTVALRHD